MSTTRPGRISIVIPMLNERHDIEGCIRAVLDQDWGLGDLEIIVVDGGSTDGSVAAAERVLVESAAEWQILQNPNGSTPSNLNAALRRVRGEIVCRVDARSIVPKHYVRCCAEVLATRPEVAVTGGAQVALAADRSAKGVGIARALNNRFAMGGARYRAGATSGPSDTVYLGAWRTRDLVAAGGWDERMTTNQDFELNRRMADQGLVWFDDRLEVGYLPRRSLRALGAQYIRFGRWKVRYWRWTGDRPRPRQWAILLAPPLASTALLAWSRLRPRRFVAAAGIAGVALAAIEVKGSDGPPGGISAHAFAALSTVVVSGGWLYGVARELIGYAKPPESARS